MKANPDALKQAYEAEYARTTGRTITATKYNGWWLLQLPAGLNNETRMREKALFRALDRLRTRPNWMDR